MAKLLSLSLIALTGVLLSPSSAAADLITVEPDSFARGAQLTWATPGVTLWQATNTRSLENPLALAPVYARHDPQCDAGPERCSAVTGSQGFSPYSDGQGTLFAGWATWQASDVANCFGWAHGNTPTPGSPDVNWCGRSSAVGASALLMEFENPTSFVQIGGAWHGDYVWMIAFDEGFNRLGLTQTLAWNPITFGYEFRTGIASMTSAAGDIKYVLASSIDGLVALDALTFERVPEPSIVLLMAVGLACGLARRKRLNATARRPNGRG